MIDLLCLFTLLFTSGFWCSYPCALRPKAKMRVFVAAKGIADIPAVRAPVLVGLYGRNYKLKDARCVLSARLADA
jgi:hypothetical protein